MTHPVFVISEWQPKLGKERALLQQFEKLVAQTRQESGCINAYILQHIDHPNSPTPSNYSLVAMQQYESVEAFEKHCAQAYVKQFFATVVEGETTALVADWRCRLFKEGE